MAPRVLWYISKKVWITFVYRALQNHALEWLTKGEMGLAGFRIKDILNQELLVLAQNG